MRRTLPALLLVLLLTGCFFEKAPDPVVRRPGPVPLPAGVAEVPIRVEGMPAVELLGFRASVDRIYGSPDGLAQAYLEGLRARLAEGMGARGGVPLTLRVLRLKMDETSVSRGFYATTVYCQLESDLELRDATGTVIWSGHLTVRSSDADFPSWHPFQARLKHAVADSQVATVQWLRGAATPSGPPAKP